MISSFRPFTLAIQGTLRTFHRPLIMGIINATGDSFYSKSRVLDSEDGLKMAARMLENGADMLDLGGQSTRPGSLRLPAAEESRQVIPLIRAISSRWPEAILSIDTYYTSVAREALEAGASIINDVSGGSFDTELPDLVARSKAPYVLMHLKGTPENMQDRPSYDDVMGELTLYFSSKLNALRERGIHDIILDPGFGFGKRLEDNYRILSHLSELNLFERPVMVGISRKKMIQQVTGADADNSLSGSLAAHVIALTQGASILRTHDVKESREALEVWLATVETDIASVNEKK